MNRARCAIDVQGFAQGIGFRPFVHALAVRLGLGGSVYNTPGFVRIEIEGEEADIATFERELRASPACATQSESLRLRAESLRGDRVFRIADSVLHGAGVVTVPPDTATCQACLEELFSADDRRAGYPFIHCTQCGPRATIVASMPYDRARTTMAPFAMCAECTREYHSPNDRRFHAQSMACPGCGPQLRLVDANGATVPSQDPIQAVADAIKGGQIVAIKGLGGFHLTCDATRDEAVTTLRQRKHRDAKPLAVMCADLEQVERLCHVDEAGRAALMSPQRAIVLLPRRAQSPLSRAVAPELSSLGVMLPYTGLHHLLLRALEGKPVVMTSGNISDEPIAISDPQVLAQLPGVFDCMLTHDRSIALRCDDSVVRATARGVTILRRSRGQAPLPIELGFEMPVPTLAVGGHSKAVFALGVEQRAVLSPHHGDLDSYQGYAAFANGIDHYERLFRAQPLRIAHDLHQDYASTRYASERAAACATLELIPVQHHHAHMASCMVDNRLSGSVIGVCFDGAGLGDDGTLWGGEFLVGGYSGFSRGAHLAYVRLPGGDRAAREPWRMALAYLQVLGLGASAVGLAKCVEARSIASLERLLETNVCCPPTSSMGRLFDAVAALSGVIAYSRHDAEAGMRLEALAETAHADGAYPVQLDEAWPCVIDVAPMIHAIVCDVQRGVSPAVVARRFHSGVVELVALTCARLRARYGLDRVVLSGGVFANAILSREVPERLEAEGFEVFAQHQVPPNDGGLCLGQLAIAAHARAASVREGLH